MAAREATADTRFMPIPGLTRVGWRNLFSGQLKRVAKRPGEGWVPVYVDEMKVWIDVERGVRDNAPARRS